MGPVLTFCADDKMDHPALGHGHSVNTRSQHNPQRKMYRAETPSRREPESLLSAPPPLCARFCSHSDFSPGSQSPNPTHLRPSATIRGSPHIRQRRYAIQPGVVRVPAPPRALGQNPAPNPEARTPATGGRGGPSTISPASHLPEPGGFPAISYSQKLRGANPPGSPRFYE